MDEQKLLEAIQGIVENTVGKQITELRTEMNQRFGAVDQRLDAVDQRLDAVDQRLDAVDQRLDAMDQRFDAMDRRFDAMDQRFDSLEERFGSLEERVSNLEIQVRANTEKLNKQGVILENDIAKAIQTIQEGHETIIQMLRKKADYAWVEDISIKVEGLQDAVAAHSRQIEELQRKAV